VRATLYSLQGSPNAWVARLALRHKGIRFRRIDLPQALHRVILPSLGFDGETVPALEVEGRLVQGTRAITRALDELQPEPALFPADAASRTRVEEAERWGEEELQPLPRTLLPLGALQRPEAIPTMLEGRSSWYPPRSRSRWRGRCCAPRSAVTGPATRPCARRSGSCRPGWTTWTG